MKFRCERDTLVDALTTAGRAVSGRMATNAATNGVRVELQGNRLAVVGTDLDLTVRVEVEAVGIADGVCVAPARLVADIVRAMEPGAVTMEALEDEVEIVAARSRFVVRTYPAMDFPVLPERRAEQLSLAVDGVAEGLRQVVPAASTDDARPLLTGVLVTKEPGSLRLVATDSYRLAWRDLPAGADLPGGTEQILVPARALKELQRLLAASAKDSGSRSRRATAPAPDSAARAPEPVPAVGLVPGVVQSLAPEPGSPTGAFEVSVPQGDADVAGSVPQGDADGDGSDGARGGSPVPPATIGFSVGELDATFWVDGVQLTTRLLDGRFPDYRQLVPPSYPSSVHVGKASLVDALRRVRLLVRDNTTPVRLTTSAHGIDLSVMSQDLGQATESVDARVEGEEVTVAFNPSYLIDGVEAAVGDEVVLEIVDATKPATVRSPDHDDYRYLLLPVRVS